MIFDYYKKQDEFHGINASVDHVIAFSAKFSKHEFEYKRLFSDDLVLLIRSGHPLRSSNVTEDDFLQLEHLKLAGDCYCDALIDRLLVESGRDLPYSAPVTIPSLSGIVPLIRHTDLCMVLPRRWANSLAEFGGLAVRELSFWNMALDVELCWRAARGREAGVRWLNGIIEAEVSPSGPKIE